VTKFLKEHVIGRTVASPKETTKLDEGRMESDFMESEFDVDAETLKRTPTKDRLPTFVSWEVVEKPGR
jgi:hypothetical protein